MALLAALASLLLLQCAASSDIPRIRQITEGPYQHLSGQPLVSLGDGYYYFESNVKANWYAAAEFCRNIGLHLAAVETAEENQLIIDYISTIGFTDYWLGGTDLSTKNGIYTWMATGKRVTFTDWHPGEPNNASGDSCTHLRFKDGLLKWNDEEPYATYNFICERICDENCAV